MTSNVYVWVWLPHDAEPVPAGILEQRSDGLWFAYGRKYLELPDAISLYSPELPLTDQWFAPAPGQQTPSIIGDGAPDDWGRCVIDTRSRTNGPRTEAFYLLNSVSNRTGALDFQVSPTEYVPRPDDTEASLAQLLSANELLDQGKSLPIILRKSLRNSTGIGGMRPKAVVTDADSVQWNAKFPRTRDPFNVIGAEAASIYLARLAGLNVETARVEHVNGEQVLLVRRFDREKATRKQIVSGLTIIGRDYAHKRGSYPELANAITALGDNVAVELFSRAAFNIAITNCDDHLKNHAAFWDGSQLTLSPAYDLTPTVRVSGTEQLALPFTYDGDDTARFSKLTAAANEFGITTSEAKTRIDTIVSVINDHWHDAADFGRLTADQRNALFSNQILNRDIFK